MKDGYLPESFVNFRQKYIVTWDIESLEQKPPVYDESNVQALQNVCCVSIASNLPYPDQYFVRESSAPEAACTLVNSFLNHLFKLQEIYVSLIPDEISSAIKKLERDIKTSKYSKAQCHQKSMLRFLKQYFTLPCYAFNGSRYDLPCLIGLIFNYCQKNECTFQSLKKGTGYMVINISKQIGERTASITCRDTLKYTAPCKLSTYLKQWGADLSKSIFPYSLYNSIEELEEACEFPPYEDFYSELTQSNVERSEYDLARSEFYRRQLLPSDHPDHIYSMKCWLKYYCCLDTKPLVQAMENAFQKFSFYFNVDPNMHLSLPTLAFK